MKSIHIRDVDPVVLKKLETLARLHHRSVQGELRQILADAARMVPDATDDWELVTTSVGRESGWSREDIYDDDR